MNILVVDHSRVFRILWEKTARSSGLESTLAANGAQGLAALRQQPVSLICVSLVLTDMDGIEFSRQARSVAAGRDVPIILLTSSGGAVDSPARLRGRRHGGAREVRHRDAVRRGEPHRARTRARLGRTGALHRG